MWSETDLQSLRSACKTLSLPQEAAKEVLKWLLVRKAVRFDQKVSGVDEHSVLALSFTLEKLLHHILLNTTLRKQIEDSLGEIEYSTETEERPAFDYAEAQLASLDALHAYGFCPTFSLWSGPGSLLIELKTVQLTYEGENGREWGGRKWTLGETCTWHYTIIFGYGSIYHAVENGPFACSEDDYRPIKEIVDFHRNRLSCCVTSDTATRDLLVRNFIMSPSTKQIRLVVTFEWQDGQVVFSCFGGFPPLEKLEFCTAEKCAVVEDSFHLLHNGEKLNNDGLKQLFEDSKPDETVQVIAVKK